MSILTVNILTNLSIMQNKINEAIKKIHQEGVIELTDPKWDELNTLVNSTLENMPAL